MSLKTAALLALAAMILVSILSVMDLAVQITGVMSGVVPPVALFRSLIYAFAGVSLAVFLYVFHKQS